MASFKDTEGRTWEIKFNLVTTKAVQEHCNLDLLEIASEQSPLLKLTEDYQQAAEGGESRSP